MGSYIPDIKNCYFGPLFVSTSPLNTSLNCKDLTFGSLDCFFMEDLEFHPPPFPRFPRKPAGWIFGAVQTSKPHEFPADFPHLSPGAPGFSPRSPGSAPWNAWANPCSRRSSARSSRPPRWRRLAEGPGPGEVKVRWKVG